MDCGSVTTEVILGRGEVAHDLVCHATIVI